MERRRNIGSVLHILIQVMLTLMEFAVEHSSWASGIVTVIIRMGLIILSSVKDYNLKRSVSLNNITVLNLFTCS